MSAPPDAHASERSISDLPSVNQSATEITEEDYIMRDLETHKVYVPFLIFLRVVFGLSTDWEKNADMTRGVDAVEKSDEYQRSLCDYLQLCDADTNEKKPYTELMATAVANADGTDTSLSVHTYWQEDQQLHRVPVTRCADLSNVLKIVSNKSGKDMKKRNDLEQGPREDEPVSVAHGKGYTHLLDDGVGACVVMEKCPDGTPQDIRPQANVAYALMKAEEAKTPIPVAMWNKGADNRLKRSRPTSNISSDSSTTREPLTKRSKIAHQSNDSTVTVVSNDTLNTTDFEHDEILRLEVSYQSARHGYHNISDGGLRSHSIGFLICKDYIQLFLHERSVIMVSAPLCFREQPRLFAVVQVCLQRMTLADRGIISSFLPDPTISSSSVLTTRMLADYAYLLETRQMILTVNGKEHAIQLGRVIARHPGLIGRTTIVYEVASQSIWPGREIIVKVNFPSDRRTSEAEFVEKIREAIKAGGKDCEWVLNHTPDILHVQDDVPIPDSVLGRVAEFFRDDEKEIVWVGDKPFDYEGRVCRVTVHEKLEPFNSLQTVQDYTQVIFDVLQVHRWIYDHPKILHRDISEGNIMWRRRNGRICGVLNDFDLASFLQNIEETSKMRTGTRPFLAHELHPTTWGKEPPTHLYRHDLESLFYVLLYLVTISGLQRIPNEEPPRFELVLYPDAQYYCWHSMDDHALRQEKQIFLNSAVTPRSTATFAEIGEILLSFHSRLLFGLSARCLSASRASGYAMAQQAKRTGRKTRCSYANVKEEPPFDDATLGGKVTYEHIMNAFTIYSPFDLEQHY